jgi:hypothetical protein
VFFGALQRHLLARLGMGAFASLVLVYSVTFLIHLLEGRQEGTGVLTLLLLPHQSAWELLSRVPGLCISVGAGLALSRFARERGGVVSAIGGSSLAVAILPCAFIFSSIAGVWIAATGSSHERAVVHWGESSWGYAEQKEDSSITWLWVDETGPLLQVDASRGIKGERPPAQALSALEVVNEGVAKWVIEFVALFLILLTLGVRMDRKPGGRLAEAVLVVLFVYWGQSAVTPLVSLCVEMSVLKSEVLSLAVISLGLWWISCRSTRAFSRDCT